MAAIPEGQFSTAQEQDFLHHKMAAIGPVVSKIAHDINNYLTVITGFTELVSLRMASEDKSSGYLQEVQKAAEQITQLTRRFQVYSRRQTARLSACDLKPILENFRKSFSRIPESIEFQLVFPPDLPPVMIDKGILEEILQHLTENAMDAMSQGGVLCVEAGPFQESDSSGLPAGSLFPTPPLLISISDTGDGFPAEILAHLYEPFQTTSDRRKGFGLFTVYALVRKLGGQIFVESRKGEGSVIRILLPFA